MQCLDADAAARHFLLRAHRRSGNRVADLRQAAQEDLAARQLFQRYELIRLVSLFDIARPADHGRDAGLLE